MSWPRDWSSDVCSADLGSPSECDDRVRTREGLLAQPVPRLGDDLQVFGGLAVGHLETVDLPPGAADPLCQRGGGGSQRLDRKSGVEGKSVTFGITLMRT